MAIGIECAGLTLLSGVVGYLGLGAWWVCLVGGGNGGGEGGLFFLERGWVNGVGSGVECWVCGCGWAGLSRAGFGRTLFGLG